MYNVQIIPVGFSYKKLLVELTEDLAKIIKNHVKSQMKTPEFKDNANYQTPITKNEDYVKISVSDKMSSLITIGTPMNAIIDIKEYTISPDKSITKQSIRGFYLQMVGFKK